MPLLRGARAQLLKRRPVLASATPVTSFSFIASSTGNSPVITITAGFAAGDLGVIFNASGSSDTNPTAGTWSGFTQLVQNGPTLFRTATILAKILDGAETTVTGTDAIGSGPTDRWICMIFRPDNPLNSFIANDFVGEIVATTPASQTISATGVTPPVILIGQMNSSGVIDPRTTSPAMNEVVGASTVHYAHYLIYNTGGTPLDNTYAMADEGTSNALQSGYLTFT